MSKKTDLDNEQKVINEIPCDEEMYKKLTELAAQVQKGMKATNKKEFREGVEQLKESADIVKREIALQVNKKKSIDLCTVEGELENIVELIDKKLVPEIIEIDPKLSGKGCAACAACTLCFADGPIPDFEVAGLIGLVGLALRQK